MCGAHPKKMQQEARTKWTEIAAHQNAIDPYWSHLYSRVEKDAQRMFVSDASKISMELWLSSASNVQFQTHRVTSEQDLEKCFKVSLSWNLELAWADTRLHKDLLWKQRTNHVGPQGTHNRIIQWQCLHAQDLSTKRLLGAD
jgi:hypothetical protein